MHLVCIPRIDIYLFEYLKPLCALLRLPSADSSKLPQISCLLICSDIASKGSAKLEKINIHIYIYIYCVGHVSFRGTGKRSAL